LTATLEVTTSKNLLLRAYVQYSVLCARLALCVRAIDCVSIPDCMLGTGAVCTLVLFVIKCIKILQYLGFVNIGCSEIIFLNHLLYAMF